MSKRWWSSSWIWIILSAVVVITAAIVGAYFFFAAPIPDGPPDTTGMSPEAAAQQKAAAELEIGRLRAEARRNALALGAGLAALAALALAVRRQYHHEQTTVKTQEDALQRRITDARVRAVEQLGSDNPAVRIGGLHNLERIGQLHPELRQVVLDEICSYLRLPYTSPDAKSKPERLPDRQFEPVGPPSAEADGAEAEGAEAEGEVRLIAQEILQRHLNPDREELYWDHSRLNLRNARLDDIDFRGCHLTGADFTEATFYDNAFFAGATFTGHAFFGQAAFIGHAGFWRATFIGHAGFGRVTFTGHAGFEEATFTGRAGFEEATFTGRAGFGRVTFTGDAGFWRATFTSDAGFGQATFIGHADFAGARFRGALLGASSIVLGALRNRGVRLRTDVEHELPEGWVLEPDPSDSAWGHLVTPGASDLGGAEG